MNIYMAQLNIAWENKKANYSKLERLLKKANPHAGSIVALPELFSTGYTMNAEAFAENLESSPTFEFLKGLAQKYHIYILGTLTMTASDGALPTNSVLAISPQGHILARYDKIHLLPISDEPQAYSPGSALSAFNVGDMRFGILICYDLRFPEVFRIFYHQGVEGMFVVANWPASRHLHWETLLRARAIENQCYLLAVNRVGPDPSNKYHGGSTVISPLGDILCASHKEEILSCLIDPVLVKSVRRQFPFKTSCNIPLYQKYAPYAPLLSED